jgi:hypothetical protein
MIQRMLRMMEVEETETRVEETEETEIESRKGKLKPESGIQETDKVRDRKTSRYREVMS